MPQEILKKTFSVPPWLTEQRQILASLLARGQSPQALLIHGPPGTGRRALAFWYVAELLGIPAERFASLCEATPGAEAPEDLIHPDLLIIQPPPEKSSIPVESIRALIEFMQLRSHQGGARTVVIWPADAMTPSAANSLLKILEEPPAGGAILLIATGVAGLPATVVSRCQRLRVNMPARGVARTWLTAEGGNADWELLLDFAGGAPLLARLFHRTGFATHAERCAQELAELRQRRTTPVAVARRWKDVDPNALLAWLYGKAAHEVLTAVDARGSANAGIGRLQNPAKPLTIRSSLETLAQIEEMYRNRSKPMNSELHYTALLQRWYGDSAGGDRV